MSSSGPTPRPATMLARALVVRCPWCGGRKLFASWFRPEPRCPTCGLVLERGEGAMLGSMAINLGVTCLAVIAAGVIVFVTDLPEPSVVRGVLVSVGVAVVVPLAFFPVAKTIWATIDLWMHASDPTYLDPDEARRLGEQRT